jgi:release factor glutamine methyltransferase
MRLIRLPGVFRPHSDSLLLAERLREELARRLHASVADVCTGSGVLAVTAAQSGAGAVAAVDVSRRAVLTARLNARLNGVRIRAVRGDLLAPLAGERFDVIVSNPPYVPSAADELPRHGARRAWDAGRDGRRVLDRICDAAPGHLAPGGAILIVQSSVCDVEQTVERLTAGGLEAAVVTRREGPLGPLLSARAAALERRGLLAPGVRSEEIAIVRGQAPARLAVERPAALTG